MTDHPGMSNLHVVLLSNGGLRSLVAAALTLHDADRVCLTLLHAIDGRDNAIVRLEHVRRQAGYFNTTRISELDVPYLYGHSAGPEGMSIGTLVQPHLLLAAVSHARRPQAEQVIWPASFNGDANAMARATEQMLLCEHLGDLEGPMPQVSAPLLELTDQQIVELGGQLEVPWRLAWSCLGQNETPCHACSACHRRQAAFAEAGMLDGTAKPVHAS